MPPTLRSRTPAKAPARVQLTKVNAGSGVSKPAPSAPEQFHVPVRGTNLPPLRPFTTREERIAALTYHLCPALDVIMVPPAPAGIHPKDYYAVLLGVNTIAGVIILSEDAKSLDFYSNRDRSITGNAVLAVTIVKFMADHNYDCHVSFNTNNTDRPFTESMIWFRKCSD
jgi:hypothetical protein